MSDKNTEKPSILGQIVMAVVITLLVGGTAPWWWPLVSRQTQTRNGGSQTGLDHSQPTPIPSQTTPPPPTATPTPLPTAQRTDDHLEGDVITHFRVADIRGRDITIDVDYTFNEQHGDKVMIGARLKGVASGYTPTFVPSSLKGSARLQMSALEAGSSTDIEIFLYEWGRPSEPFVTRTFSYRMRFE